LNRLNHQHAVPLQFILDSPKQDSLVTDLRSGKIDVVTRPLAAIIRTHLFTFEDVFRLDDRSIQSVMREISNDTLTLAMKTSPDEVKDKIFKNISSRAAEMIKEDLEVMGPVRLSDVEKAQSEIIKIVRKMEEEGKIVLAGRGGDDVLV